MRHRFFYSIIISGLLFFGSNSYSADIENGKELFKFCTLCHGKVGQGVIGGDFPKIGGLPEYYMQHQFDLSPFQKYEDLLKIKPLILLLLKWSCRGQRDQSSPH